MNCVKKKCEKIWRRKLIDISRRSQQLRYQVVLDRGV
jgi:hypothetical protein